MDRVVDFFIPNFVYFIREKKHMKQVTIDKILNGKHNLKKKKIKKLSFWWRRCF